MKILFVIPHYYGPGPSLYGSTDESRRTQRITALRATITSLHQHLGSKQTMFHRGQDPKQLNTSNQAISTDIDIVICTTGENHLLHELGLPGDCYRQQSVEENDPLYLGYSCYDVFKYEFGRYDWYCYLEDDIVITDPLFFRKMQAFYSTVQDAGYLLQPHRYEVSENPCGKTYIDGQLWDDEVMASFRLPNSRSQIDLPFLDASFRMIPAENAHSGCFFLTSAHMQRLLEQPWYGKRVTGFAGPLESAATLFILAVFHVFKPAAECAGFLEVRHAHQRYVR